MFYLVHRCFSRAGPVIILIFFFLNIRPPPDFSPFPPPAPLPFCLFFFPEPQSQLGRGQPEAARRACSSFESAQLGQEAMEPDAVPLPQPPRPPAAPRSRSPDRA